jgi:hypothetical protein
MTERQPPYPSGEPVIGGSRADYGDANDFDEGFDDEYIGAPVAAPPETGIGDDAWYEGEEDPYQDPYDDYFYDEYYENEPARQPLFYVFIGLAVILGAVFVFFLYNAFSGGDDSVPAAPTPDFNVAIEGIENDQRITVNEDVEVRLAANATEQIVLLELLLEGDAVDEVEFNEPPADGIYRATLTFSVEETGTYALAARATSESGAQRTSNDIRVVAVESIDGRPVRITAEAVTNANTREGPGDEFPAVRTLSPGTVVTVVGRTRNNQWLLLEDDTWVRRAAVQLSEAIDLAPVREPTPAPRPTNTPAPEETETPTATPSADTPDLSPVDASLAGGGTILQVTIANLGAGSYDGPVVVRVSGLGSVLEQVFNVSLSGNGGATVEFSLPSAQTEAVAVQVSVDPDNSIEESGEDNNTATFSLAPPVEAPEIVIAGVEVSGSAVTVTISNVGGNLSTSDISVTVALPGSQTSTSGTVSLANGESQSFQTLRPSGSGIATVTVSVGGQETASTTIEIPADEEPTATPEGLTEEPTATEG